MMRNLMGDAATFIKMAKRKDDVVIEHVLPPLPIAEAILALPSYNGFPILRGITEAPILRADGSIADNPGYDVITETLYWPTEDFKLSLVPDTPTKQDVKDSIEGILDFYQDFDYDCDASRANAIGALLTPAARRLFSGKIPMAIYDKPIQGAGASYHPRMASYIYTGQDQAFRAMPKEDYEMRKTITSVLMRGASNLCFDNVVAPIDLPSLSVILTGAKWGDRTLGANSDFLADSDLLVSATGINVQLGGDMPRRCFIIRLDPQTPRPWERSDFQHKNLLKDTKDNRGKLLAMIYTIIRGWIQAGRPTLKTVPVMGGYEEWAETLGSILAYAGTEHFLENNIDLFEKMDTTTTEWQSFFCQWMDDLGSEPITVNKLKEQLKENDDLRACLPKKFADGIGERGWTNRFGIALTKVKDRPFIRTVDEKPTYIRLEQGQPYKNAATWAVVSFQPKTHQKLASAVSFGESSTPLPTRVKTNNNSNYIDGGPQTHQDSPLASKSGGSSGQDSPEDCKQFILQDSGDGDGAGQLPPDYPHDYCPTCGGGDYWLTPWNKWQCSKCHPKPEGS